MAAEKIHILVKQIDGVLILSAYEDFRVAKETLSKKLDEDMSLQTVTLKKRRRRKGDVQ